MPAIRNVRAVLADEVLEDATVVTEAGVVTEVTAGGTAPPGAVDGRGAYLLPGLVDTHSDGLEKELQPRPSVLFDVGFGLASFEGRVRASGITTVFHATGFYGDDAKGRSIAGALAREQAIRERVRDGLAQIDHRMLFRLDARDPAGLAALDETLREHYTDAEIPPLVSYEDHTPGQGQFRDVDAYVRLYLVGEDEAAAKAAVQAKIADRDTLVWHRDVALRWLVERRGSIRLLGHDPVTPEEVAHLAASSVTVAEFPTTLAAARAAREHGMPIVAGAPNVLRGGSHSGNVSAAELIAHGLVDGLSSDYMPFTMIGAAFHLTRTGQATLPAAVRLVSEGPARVAGIADRGRLAVGARADLSLVTVDAGWPTVRSTWSVADSRELVEA